VADGLRVLRTTLRERRYRKARAAARAELSSLSNSRAQPGAHDLESLTPDPALATPNPSGRVPVETPANGVRVPTPARGIAVLSGPGGENENGMVDLTQDQVIDLTQDRVIDLTDGATSDSREDSREPGRSHG
jgi:hypothetical protein